MTHNFTAQWIKGANNNAPSHHLVCDPQPAETLAEIDNPEI